ncbi:hypothetical protein XENOCAPTIV_022864 [Xenoophorus captivus]|uniref:Uncharacterized protein n=1 Tax=Xenoophorus captivus TaxID=1517983 RepID=A0ABV0SBB7_9TELE
MRSANGLLMLPPKTEQYVELHKGEDKQATNEPSAMFLRFSCRPSCHLLPITMATPEDFLSGPGTGWDGFQSMKPLLLLWRCDVFRNFPVTTNAPQSRFQLFMLRLCHSRLKNDSFIL